MLISVHVAKTAGTSFRKSLEMTFGERLCLTYKARPLSPLFKDKIYRLRKRIKVFFDRNKIVSRYDVIHGHFAADAYDFLPEPRRYCIFLRKPVDRMISHYLMWKDRNQLWGHAIRDIHDLAGIPAMVNYYSIFLGGKKIEEFDFVGLTEEYTTSIQLFNKIFSMQLIETRENLTDTKRYEGVLSSNIDYDLLRRTQKRNQEIYDRGRRRFDQLCRQFL